MGLWLAKVVCGLCTMWLANVVCRLCTMWLAKLVCGLCTIHGLLAGVVAPRCGDVSSSCCAPVQAYATNCYLATTQQANRLLQVRSAGRAC